MTLEDGVTMRNAFVHDIEDDEDDDVVPVVTTTTPTVRSTITSPPPRPESSGKRDLLVSGGQSWNWEQLRDYVIRRIAETSRTHFTRDPLREASIFKAFIGRWGGDQARQIAVFVFDTQAEPGWWKSAPITPTRFCKGADKYFAEEIAAKLNS